MAFKTGRCNAKTVQYDAACTFSCTCLKSIMMDTTVTICHWSVRCNGKRVAGGSGGARPRIQPDTTTTVSVDGRLRDLAAELEDAWGRSVRVPRAKLDERVKGRFTGTPETICERLGLTLGN